MSNDVISINSKRKQLPTDSLTTSIELLEKYLGILNEMKDSGVECMELTVAGETFKFVPRSLCVALGDGATIISEGMHRLNAIEALGLQSKLREIVLGDSI